MRFSALEIVLGVLGVLCMAAIMILLIIGIVLAFKITTNALFRKKERNNQQEAELHRMNVEDL
jgi:heme/copper-type cytochrome/quinol oxidase subunit 2